MKKTARELSDDYQLLRIIVSVHVLTKTQVAMYDLFQDRRRTMGGGAGGSGQYPDSHQLFVGNLPHNCTERDLEELFGKFGKVRAKENK